MYMQCSYADFDHLEDERNTAFALLTRVQSTTLCINKNQKVRYMYLSV